MCAMKTQRKESVMKIRSNTRKVFKMTPEDERQGYLVNVLLMMNQCRKRMTDKFNDIIELLESGEYHNSNTMKMKKRILNDLFGSFGNYSTLFLEWNELMDEDYQKQNSKRKD